MHLDLQMQIYFTVITKCLGQEVWNNSRSTAILCGSHYRMGYRTVLVNSQLKWQNSDEYKILGVKNCCMECSAAQ